MLILIPLVPLPAIPALHAASEYLPFAGYISKANKIIIIVQIIRTKHILVSKPNFPLYIHILSHIKNSITIKPPTLCIPLTLNEQSKQQKFLPSTSQICSCGISASSSLHRTPFVNHLFHFEFLLPIYCTFFVFTFSCSRQVFSISILGIS